jgi:hypothetical protein
MGGGGISRSHFSSASELFPDMNQRPSRTKQQQVYIVQVHVCISPWFQDSL